jgi:hypothetical protein
MNSYTILDTAKDPLPPIQVGLPFVLVGESKHQFLLKTTTEGAPIYIQTPVCNIKQFSTRSGSNKKSLYELIIPTFESEFFTWIEKVEKFSINHINDFKEEWFTTTLTEEDIDHLFLTPFTIYRKTQTYGMRILVSDLGSSSCRIFDSSKNPIEYNEEEHKDKQAIAVIELIGIRCTVKNFTLEFELRQLMFVDEKELKPLASECLIQKPPAFGLHTNNTHSESSPVIATEGVKLDSNTGNTMTEVNLDTELAEEGPGDEAAVTIKTNAEIYQEIYEKALKRALMARDLGVLNYLESKKITDTDILLDTTDSQI